MSRKVHEIRSKAQRIITDMRAQARESGQDLMYTSVRQWFAKLPPEKKELVFALTLFVTHETATLSDIDCGAEFP